MENDGHEEKQIYRQTIHWVLAASRSRHTDQGDRLVRSFMMDRDILIYQNILQAIFFEILQLQNFRI